MAAQIGRSPLNLKNDFFRNPRAYSFFQAIRLLRQYMVEDRAGNGEAARLVEVQGRIGTAERRLVEVEDELARLIDQNIDEDDVAAALAEFDAVWAALKPNEQARVLELLIERVQYDGKAGDIAITFRPSGIKTLAAETAEPEESAA